MKKLLALAALGVPFLLSAMDVKLGGRGEVTFGDGRTVEFASGAASSRGTTVRFAASQSTPPKRSST